MTNYLIALAIKPLVLFLLALFVLYPARRAVMRWKESRLKKLLLTHVGPEEPPKS